jgi:hypothetical protein
MTNKKLILLVGLVWVVVAGVLVLALVLTSSGNLEPAAHRSLGSVSETARGVYPLTEKLALDWRDDAVLVGITAGWRAATLENLRQPHTWSFQFYSPGQQETYVTVVTQGEARGVRKMLVPYPLPAIPVDEWAVDSSQAVEMWLDNGGSRFLEQHPTDAELRLQLRAMATNQDGAPQLVWTVTGIVFKTNQVKSVQIDATSGKLVR